VKRVLSILQGEEFNADIRELPGYTAKDAGMIKTVREAFQ
jgi:hypothetical protein